MNYALRNLLYARRRRAQNVVEVESTYGPSDITTHHFKSDAGYEVGNQLRKIINDKGIKPTRREFHHDNVVATQPHISRASVDYIKTNKDSPGWRGQTLQHIKDGYGIQNTSVATYKGKHYVLDGHHRITADYELGKHTFTADHYDLGEQVVYHGTSADRAASIQAVGLVPYVGNNTKDKEGHDVEAHVCLTTDKKVAKKYAGHDGTVFAVELDSPHLNGVKPEPDEFERSSVKVNTRIPPTALTVAERFKKAVVAFNSTKAKASRAESRRNFTN